MSEPLRLIIDRINTPISEMLIVVDKQENIRAVDWSDYESRTLLLLRRHYGTDGFTLEPGKIPRGITDAVKRYFTGALTALDALPVATAGTPFQRAVWQALREIPCGTTVSYATLAQKIGKPSAMRAVGLANGSNPIGVVVPCHRVIGADGSLTGYGGGLDRKRWLLDHESNALVFGKSASA